MKECLFFAWIPHVSQPVYAFLQFDVETTWWCLYNHFGYKTPTRSPGFDSDWLIPWQAVLQKENLSQEIMKYLSACEI